MLHCTSRPTLVRVTLFRPMTVKCKNLIVAYVFHKFYAITNAGPVTNRISERTRGLLGVNTTACYSQRLCGAHFAQQALKPP